MLESGMYFPNSSTSNVSNILISHQKQDSLVAPSHFYCPHQQPYTVQVIELVECPHPPPRDISPPATSSYYSSSYTSSSCGSDSEECDEESICESYCSSVEQDHHSCDDDSSSLASQTSMDSAFSATMKSILVWRERAMCIGSSTAPHDAPRPSSPLKRKLSSEHYSSDDDSDGDDDTAFRKRSRSQGPDEEMVVDAARSKDDSGSHIWACSACDAAFSAADDLKRHGEGEQVNEACAAAVQYAFE
ncbi:hypothetical protein AX16_003914 [Volvariella volvacea WC 439]|nr:hypothetical protein AX16_003914 [Volvariella volvacea WC 439]